MPRREDAPAANLALDEALLESPREALRFYGWSPPGLSFGYFQPVSDSMRELATSRGFVAVRRPTGGGAIAHVDELTFALTDRVGGVFGADPRDDVTRLHGVFQRVLQARGLDVRLRGDASLESDLADQRWLCFAKSSDLDLVVEGRKLLGSAARRNRGKVLIHGSLPLGKNPWTPAAASLEECLGAPPEVDALEAELAEEFAREYGRRLVREPASEVEEARAAALVASRYGVAEWTQRR